MHVLEFCVWENHSRLVNLKNGQGHMTFSGETRTSGRWHKAAGYDGVVASFSIRAARPTDHQALASVLAELLNKPQLSKSIASALNTNLLRLLSNPGAALLLAEGEEGVLGFVSLWTRWGLLDEAPSGFIDRIVVRAAYQDKAVAPALLEQALGACQALGCSEVDFVPAEGSLVPLEALGRFGFSRAREGRYSLSIRGR